MFSVYCFVNRLFGQGPIDPVPSYVFIPGPLGYRVRMIKCTKSTYNAV